MQKKTHGSITRFVLYIRIQLTTLLCKSDDDTKCKVALKKVLIHYGGVGVVFYKKVDDVTVYSRLKRFGIVE